MEKIAVLSDIHFGADECNLNCPTNGRRNKKVKTKIDRLFDWFISNDTKEFIFLGDIFELHLDTFSDSIDNSGCFFARLNALGPTKVTYVVGNHDHTIWLLHIYYHDIIDKFLGGNPKELTPFRFVNRRFTAGKQPSFLAEFFGSPKDFSVVYPIELRDDIGNKNFVFLHGHLLDKKQQIVGLMLGMIFPGMRSANLRELELFCAPQYESLFLLSESESGKENLKDIYGGIKKKRKWKKAFNYRVLPHLYNKRLFHHLSESELKFGVESIARTADYVIFGHSHVAGINFNKFSYNKNLIAMNSGCWITNERIGSKKLMGHFILIDKNGVDMSRPRLYSYFWNVDNPEEHEDSVALRQGRLPRNRIQRYDY